MLASASSWHDIQGRRWTVSYFPRTTLASIQNARRSGLALAGPISEERDAIMTDDDTNDRRMNAWDRKGVWIRTIFGFNNTALQD